MTGTCRNEAVELVSNVGVRLCADSREWRQSTQCLDPLCTSSRAFGQDLHWTCRIQSSAEHPPIWAESVRIVIHVETKFCSATMHVQINVAAGSCSSDSPAACGSRFEKAPPFADAFALQVLQLSLAHNAPTATNFAAHLSDSQSSNTNPSQSEFCHACFTAAPCLSTNSCERSVLLVTSGPKTA